jgi:hypothetical protein
VTPAIKTNLIIARILPIHIVMALFACAALFAARPVFRSTEDIQS